MSNTVEEYEQELELNCIWDLEILDTSRGFTRLALPDGENSIWVCDICGELSDPDFPDCDCYDNESED
jgi:hypothetical protein